MGVGSENESQQDFNKVTKQKKYMKKKGWSILFGIVGALLMISVIGGSCSKEYQSSEELLSSRDGEWNYVECDNCNNYNGVDIELHLNQFGTTNLIDVASIRLNPYRSAFDYDPAKDVVEVMANPVPFPCHPGIWNDITQYGMGCGTEIHIAVKKVNSPEFLSFACGGSQTGGEFQNGDIIEHEVWIYFDGSVPWGAMYLDLVQHVGSPCGNYGWVPPIPGPGEPFHYTPTYHAGSPYFNGPLLFDESQGVINVANFVMNQPKNYPAPIGWFPMGVIRQVLVYY